MPLPLGSHFLAAACGCSMVAGAVVARASADPAGTLTTGRAAVAAASTVAADRPGTAALALGTAGVL